MLTSASSPTKLEQQQQRPATRGGGGGARPSTPPLWQEVESAWTAQLQQQQHAHHYGGAADQQGAAGTAAPTLATLAMPPSLPRTTPGGGAGPLRLASVDAPAVALESPRHAAGVGGPAAAAAAAAALLPVAAAGRLPAAAGRVAGDDVALPPAHVLSIPGSHAPPLWSRPHAQAVAASSSTGNASPFAPAAPVVSSQAGLAPATGTGSAPHAQAAPSEHIVEHRGLSAYRGAASRAR